MRDEHDRTGVFRRQLFQTIASDTRLAFIRASPSSGRAAEPAQLKWVFFLQTVCGQAAVEHCTERLAAAAEDLGVGLQTEVVQFAKDLADAAGLKVLEKRRFLKAVASAPAVPLTPRLRVKTSPSQSDAQGREACAGEEDVFGFNCLGMDSP